MKIFLRYLKERALVILLLVLCAACVVLVNWLYGNPINASLYAVVIGAAIFLAYGFYDFVKYYTFTKSLINMENKIVVEIEKLPEPHDTYSLEYTKLLKLLFDAKQESEHRFDYKYKELVEYYTLWAHQIKTPIQAMRLLNQTNDEENVEIALELMKIEQYVDMVLTFLKLDGNASDLVIENQNIDPILKAAVKKNKRQFILKKLSLNYGEINIKALTDAKWLQFAVEQILSNSLKYTKEGSVSISQVDEYSIVITDTGIGIAPEDLPRVFERGYTGYNGREDKKATGIGLYLAHEMLKKLGHKIRIESTVGEGTSVYINFKSSDVDTRD